jgi:hypothetical protein
MQQIIDTSVYLKKLSCLHRTKLSVAYPTFIKYSCFYGNSVTVVYSRIELATEVHHRLQVKCTANLQTHF